MQPIFRAFDGQPVSRVGKKIAKVTARLRHLRAWGIRHKGALRNSSAALRHCEGLLAREIAELGRSAWGTKGRREAVSGAGGVLSNSYARLYTRHWWRRSARLAESRAHMKEGADEHPRNRRRQLAGRECAAAEGHARYTFTEVSGLFPGRATSCAFPKWCKIAISKNGHRSGFLAAGAFDFIIGTNVCTR